MAAGLDGYSAADCVALLREAALTAMRRSIDATDVTAADKQTVDKQVEGHLIKVWVYNSQNVSPDVQRVNEIAHERGIPVATVTETLSPQSDSFEQWQVAELEGLMRALHAATGH